MSQQKGATQLDCEALEYFWAVPDMMQFENVGFTNSVDNIKYLTCADCELGPIGYQDSDTKINYVSIDRIKHQH